MDFTVLPAEMIRLDHEEFNLMCYFLINEEHSQETVKKYTGYGARKTQIILKRLRDKGFVSYRKASPDLITVNFSLKFVSGNSLRILTKHLNNKSINSIERRVLAHIATFSSDDGISSLRRKEISKITGIKKTSVQRAIYSLNYLGFLKFTSDKWLTKITLLEPISIPFFS